MTVTVLKYLLHCVNSILKYDVPVLVDRLQTLSLGKSKQKSNYNKTVVTQYMFSMSSNLVEQVVPFMKN